MAVAAHPKSNDISHDISPITNIYKVTHKCSLNFNAAKLLKLRHITKGYTSFFIEVVIFNHTKNRGACSATAIKWEMQTVSGAGCGAEPQQQAAVQIKHEHRLLWSACRGVLLAKRSAVGRVHRGELASVDATRPEAQACVASHRAITAASVLWLVFVP